MLASLPRLLLPARSHYLWRGLKFAPFLNMGASASSATTTAPLGTDINPVLGKFVTNFGERTHVWDEEPLGVGIESRFGFAPIKLGQRIPSAEDPGVEVEFVSKLGIGMSSSVWLVKVSPVRHMVYYALKVLTANSSIGEFMRLRNEESVLFKFVQHRDEPGFQYINGCRRSLVVDTPWGPAKALIFLAHGSTLTDLIKKQPNRRLTTGIAKRIARQVLAGLVFIHRHGVVHTDLKSCNIMPRVLYPEDDNRAQRDALITEHLVQHPPTTYAPVVVPELSQEPFVTVRSQPLPTWGLADDLSNITIAISDFGQAAFASADSTREIQPDSLRAPEVSLGHPWSYPVDVWSFGCLVYEWLVGIPLFPALLTDYHRPSGVSTAQWHIDSVVEMCGQDGFSAEFLGRCTRREEVFNDDGTLKWADRANWHRYNIAEVLKAFGCEPSTVDEAAAFIGRCLVIDPTARASAAELLNHSWLRDA